jgi:hypothetical protein
VGRRESGNCRTARNAHLMIAPSPRPCYPQTCVSTLAFARCLTKGLANEGYELLAEFLDAFRFQSKNATLRWRLRCPYLTTPAHVLVAEGSGVLDFNE